jgi:hypothetical protein
MNINRTLFAHWAPGALDETIVQAEQIVSRHDGNVGKALESIAELAGGNVSLSCRAHFQPIERVLRAAREAEIEQLNREVVKRRNERYHETAAG